MRYHNKSYWLQPTQTAYSWFCRVRKRWSQIRSVQHTTRKILQATEQAQKDVDAGLPFILVQGDGWHQGVVGIVAGRLKERFNLPSFVLSVEGNEAKGSSRSVPGVDLGTLVITAMQKGILSRGGGHPMAAGFSLQADRIDDFREFLKDYITSHCTVLADAPQELLVDGVYPCRS